LRGIHTPTTASGLVVPSVWIERRETNGARGRYVVKYRLGGRESAHRYAGSFATRSEALARRRWVAGELAAMRVPHLRRLDDASQSVPTLAAVAERWRASRVDVVDGTAVGHRVQLGRVLPLLGSRRVDQITPADVAELVTVLHAAGRKRETIRKSVSVLAQVLDFAGVKENPARDRVHVRLPRQEREEPMPPTADQIEAVLPIMPRLHALAVLVLDATGMRVGELEEKGLRCGDLDEPRTRWRIRRAVEKGRRGRWVSLPPDLFDAVVATLPAREDRPRDRPVFPGLTQERLRTAIARACKASGTPTWSPHDLRHRRISLWHRQGETWALIGARVGQRSLSVTADTYTHVLLDDRELEHANLVARLNS
jgi:integrase